MPNEGAFYGPKIEFSLRDYIGRIWQCGTMQIDFVIPGKLNSLYTNKDNFKLNPVVLHRAILGSIERFIGIMLEENKGYLPFWINPNKIAIISVKNKHTCWIACIYRKIGYFFQEVKVDMRNKRLSYKLKNNIKDKTKYILIIGSNENKNKTLSLYYKNSLTVNMSLSKFVRKIKLDLYRR